MFFKKILIKFLAMPLVVIMIWINGIVDLIYQLTIKEWVDKKMYKRKEKFPPKIGQWGKRSII